MDSAMTAQEIGEAWIAFVTGVFMLENGCIRPDVEEEYKELENSKAIYQEREMWREYIDGLLEKLLQENAETRQRWLSSIDRKTLVFVQDRIQCGTELLTALIRRGLKINVAPEALPAFFRQVLLQKQEQTETCATGEEEER